MVLHVGVAHARRDADGARTRGKQRCLGNAPAFAALKTGRAAIRLIAREVLEWVVAHAVARGVIERHRLVAIVGAFRVLRGKCAHRRMVAVDETSGLQILVHWSSFMSLRAPRKRAPPGSARPSTTEK